MTVVATVAFQSGQMTELLCSGKDPVYYIMSRIQPSTVQVTLSSFSKNVYPFPHSVVMKNPGKSLFCKLKVYCLCCLPHTGDSMVQYMLRVLGMVPLY